MISRLIAVTESFISWVERAAPLLVLAIRLDVAWVFFKSGLVKIRNWETTVALFTDEYRVPLLPPELAAFMGTAGELVLPVLLALGFAGRFAAAGLSVVNIVAVISYYHALGHAGLQAHYYWGMALLVPLLFGPGKLSIDHFVWPAVRRATA